MDDPAFRVTGRGRRRKAARRVLPGLWIATAALLVTGFALESVWIFSLGAWAFMAALVTRWFLDP
ncbi:hypothetical protein O7599_18325 [Streptomyces sp. WMMC500]|uniref:hypothetical protein n=1 Tax=Streptomyces sp. WMMC500 TaxID=3015154 RepID=UPI00248AC62D|nr:hypothetical protein [Streptomyces sp. WMMC500]WBB64342.1 hypothetical protein O7599_18325 [Streptomyces sp. WMMC500]